MNKTKTILFGLVSLSFILGTLSVSYAKMEPRATKSQFSRIEQPLPLKLFVTLGGFGIIGAEVWWFLFSQTKSKQATTNQGIQEVKIIVDGGYKVSQTHEVQ